ncbi:hypothetical protein GPECTOR_30g284 [Gonium pectorale]|uniref:UPF3 domain-containing protein n=1 Tax=Gonium pectorale TaxID=33097 RepID=A0A150GEE9_GONPE|nr:hypothetical protein GPECTOR_30g284 [Gonium pectorale]|eukprot:KXZ48188.1 hypothetical protein GPECTOR_30g284 [Gonium pectorale]
MSASRPKTKVVVRGLPPGMTEETFKTVLDSISRERYSWLSYYPGKFSLKRMVFSRAYVNFLTAEDVYDFKQRFDGHVFIGQKGHQYRCAVEYAPLQKVPALEEKPHPLEGTIEKDADYMAFVEALESGRTPGVPVARTGGGTATDLPSAAAAAAATSAGAGEGKVVMSRLMEYLVAKYSEGGNRVGGMRSVSKARQSKQDIQQVQVLEGRGAGSSKISKAAAAAAAAAATAALASAAALEGPSSGKPGRREKERDRERLAKGSQAAAAAAAEPGSGKSARGPGAKSHQRAGQQAAAAGNANAASPFSDMEVGSVSLLTRPSAAAGAAGAGGKAGAKESAAEGRQRPEARQRLAQAAMVRAGIADAEPAPAAAAAPPAAQEGGRGRGGGRGGARGQQEEEPQVVRPPAGAPPRILLVKGGEARATQPSSQAAPAKPAESGRPARGKAAPAAERPSSKGSASGPAPAPAASRPAAAAPAPAGETATASASVDEGLAATASAAAAAALAAARTAAGKKVRAGFQMYVPGSLRARGQTGAAGGAADGAKG